MATWAASSPGWKVRIVTANSPSGQKCRTGLQPTLPDGLFALVRADHPQGRAFGSALPQAERPQHYRDAGERHATRRQDGPGTAEHEQDRPDPGQDQTTDAVEDEVYSIIQRDVLQTRSKMARSQCPRQ